MRNLSLALLLAVPFVLPLASSAPASAAPRGGSSPAFGAGAVPQHLVEVKNGKGHARKIGRRDVRSPYVSRSDVGRSFGWRQGRKTGWRGGGCPPGLAKQGRC